MNRKGTGIVLGAALLVVLFGAGAARGENETAKVWLSWQEPVRLLFVGDVMLDRSVRSVGEQKGYPFLLEQVRDVFSQYDAVVANLECPVTGFSSVSRGTEIGALNNTRFTCAPEALEALHESGVTIAHIGNNHILDFGRGGVGSTRHFLAERGMQYFGDIEGEGAQRIYVDAEDVRIALVSFNQFSGNGVPAARSLVSDARRHADAVVVYTHWGDEYVVRTPEYLRTSAHALVDAGADLIIGSHPHVVGEHEVYRDAHIYYSLGNFIFDQYWSADVRCGLAVEAAFTKRGLIELAEYPTVFEAGVVHWNACR